MPTAPLATRLRDMAPECWTKLAVEIGFAAKYAKRRVTELTEKTVEAARMLRSRSEHDQEIVAKICDGIEARAAKIHVTPRCCSHGDYRIVVAPATSPDAVGLLDQAGISGRFESSSGNSPSGEFSELPRAC